MRPNADVTGLTRVAGYEDRLAAALLDQLRDLFTAFLLEIAQGDLGTTFCERNGRGFADAGGASGNDGHGSFECSCHGRSPSCKSAVQRE
jgi:hypothetical protein